MESSIRCSPLPPTTHTVRSPPFRARTIAPVMPSSLKVLASSFFAPIRIDCRAVVRDTGCARQLRLLEAVDILDVNFGRKVRVAIQQVFAGLHAARLVEIVNGDVLLQVADDLLGLIGKREALVGGRVVAILL